ncbi:MAG: hypothetical protein IJL77_06770 [Clostridia bacterium]|nr:hypothetical protein [Clostridia bacterium]
MKDNYSYLPLEYYMTFSNGEKSDVYEWEENLTGEERGAYLETLLFSIPPENSPILLKAADRAKREIIEGGLDDFVPAGADYVLTVRFAQKY